MSAAVSSSLPRTAPFHRVALAGNPNTGKTTLFNRLTGLSAKVGNYPGVTVEREIGHFALPRAGEVELSDVPGTYSLTARSAEEQIAIQAICGLHPLERPEAVVLVIDATQLTRNMLIVRFTPRAFIDHANQAFACAPIVLSVHALLG